MINMTKKYRTRDGRYVRVLCVDREGTQPVVALVKYTDGTECLAAFDADGKYRGVPSDFDLIEVGPYEDFKIDEPVMVSDTSDGCWEPWHFAGVNERGRPLTWSNGGTSWSTNVYVEWKFCRRPTEEELLPVTPK